MNEKMAIQYQIFLTLKSIKSIIKKHMQKNGSSEEDQDALNRADVLITKCRYSLSKDSFYKEVIELEF